MEVEKKEIPIEWEGRKEVVVIKKLSFHETNELYDDPSVLEQRIIGKIVDVKVKTGKLKEVAMLKSIMKAPFKIDMTTFIDPSFPNEIGNQIFEEINKLSKLSLEKKIEP
jgi:hypothetical protein